MKILATLKERFRAEEQQRERTAAESYEELVTAIADGAEPTFEDVHTVLQAVDRTVEQLERDVATVVRRRELAAILAERPALQAERQKLLNEHQAEADRFVKFRDAHRQRMNDLETQRAAVDARLASCGEAREEMLRTCRDGNLRHREEMLQAKLSGMRQRRQEIKADLWGYSSVGKFDSVVADSSGSRFITLQARLEQCERDNRNGKPVTLSLDKARRELEAFERTVIQPRTEEYEQLGRDAAKIERELESIRERKLQP